MAANMAPNSSLPFLSSPFLPLSIASEGDQINQEKKPLTCSYVADFPSGSITDCILKIALVSGSKFGIEALICDKQIRIVILCHFHAPCCFCSFNPPTKFQLLSTTLLLIAALPLFDTTIIEVLFLIRITFLISNCPILLVECFQSFV